MIDIRNLINTVVGLASVKDGSGPMDNFSNMVAASSLADIRPEVVPSSFRIVGLGNDYLDILVRDQAAPIRWRQSHVRTITAVEVGSLICSCEVRVIPLTHTFDPYTPATVRVASVGSSKPKPVLLTDRPDALLVCTGILHDGSGKCSRLIVRNFPRQGFSFDGFNFSYSALTPYPEFSTLSSVELRIVSFIFGGN